MVKIGIVDSGLDKASRLRDDVIDGVGFYIENDTLYMTDEYDDECGHGTQCAEIIKKYCEDVKMYIVKIVDESGFCDSVLLLQALEHLCEIDLDIINISLSVTNNNYREQFNRVIERLHMQGKTINISVRNGQQISFPADVPNCYGVIGNDIIDRQYEYYSNECIQIHSNMYPEFVPTINGKSQWFGGNSKATAMMSGIMGRWIENETNKVVRIETNLRDGVDSVKKHHKQKEIDKSDREMVFGKISKTLEKYYRNDTLSYVSCFWNGKECYITDSYKLLLELQDILQIELVSKVISYEDMSTCDMFIEYLCRLLREGKE